MQWIPIKDKQPPADMDVVLYHADLNKLFIGYAGKGRTTPTPWVATHWLPLKEVLEEGDMPDLPKNET